MIRIMNIKMKQVKNDNDINKIAEIAEKVWHSTFDELLEDGQVEYMLDKFQSEEAIKNQINGAGYIYYMILDEKDVIGYVGYVPHYKEDDEIFLSKIYILNEYQGKGISSKAIHFLIEEAKHLSLSKIWLTVNKYNTQAWQVYEHLGFKKIDSVVSDIGNGYVMDDYIMQLDL